MIGNPISKFLARVHNYGKTINEQQQRQQVVVFTGRFHPPHPGHVSAHQWGVDQFPQAQHYITTSRKQDNETRPFAFEDKQTLFKMLLPDVEVHAVTSPYNIMQTLEIIGLDDQISNIELIYLVSEKDEDRLQRMIGKSFAMYSIGEQLQSADTKAYLAMVPVTEFGDGSIKDASIIRSEYGSSDPQQQQSLLEELYGSQNASTAKEIFDRSLT